MRNIDFYQIQRNVKNIAACSCQRTRILTGKISLLPQNMAHRTPLLFIVTVTIASSVPAHGHDVTLDPRGAGKTVGENVVTFFLQSWSWATIGIASISFLSLAYLLLLSTKAFFMHRNKQPHHLFSGEPVNGTVTPGAGVYGDARTGQLFCTLTVLSVFFFLAFFPMYIVFVILPMQFDNLPIVLTTMTSPIALTSMVSCLGGALGAGALLTLVSHRRCLHFGKAEGVQPWKRVLDLAIVGFMIIFTVIQTVLYSIPVWSMTTFEAMNAMGHLYNAFYALAVLDIFFSAIFLRRRLNGKGIHDQVRKIQ